MIDRPATMASELSGMVRSTTKAPDRLKIVIEGAYSSTEGYTDHRTTMSVAIIARVESGSTAIHPINPLHP